MKEESNRLYSIFDDGTLATIVSVPQIHFHREPRRWRKPLVLRW